MTGKINRRQALVGVSSALLLPAAACTTATPRPGDARNEVFAHGVASGDPDATSIVLWTRVSTDARVADGLFEVAADERFNELVFAGGFTTDASRDYTVKIVVSDLNPGTRYYYRFLHEGTASPIGRTRTLPVGHLDRLGIAVASCSNYPFGYFNAYEAIANDPAIDLVLHLGDYLYEYPEDGYGGPTGVQLGRVHAPTHEIITLADYRMRHAQYKADPESQAMHAAHPLIAIWDDHESANNPWMHGAENHQPDTEGPWETRRDISLQAYYEWMPVRDPGMASDRAKYWRHYRFGDLASLVTLETRHTGRVEQVNYNAWLPEIRTSQDIDHFIDEVMGGAGRYMLSSEMESFLSTSLRECVNHGRTWRMIGNQIPMARTHAAPIEHPYFDRLRNNPDDPAAGFLSYADRIGELNLPIFSDTWGGYPVARERFYRTCTGAGVSDLLVLTGDTHAFWQNELFDDAGAPMGVELGTSGITSPAAFKTFGAEGAVILDEQLAAHNPEINWTDSLHNGYIRLELTHDGGRADYVYVTDILSRNYEARVLRSVDLQTSGGRLGYA